MPINITDDLATASTVNPLRPGLTDIGRRRPASKVVRVLVLDDNEDDFAYVKILLGKSLMCTYRVEWVQTEEAAVEALQRGSFDVGLFDYKLGGTTGLEILRTLQAQQCDIPIILLTGSENPEIDL
jgi:CheY-like chemotaxis protein